MAHCGFHSLAHHSFIYSFASFIPMGTAFAVPMESCHLPYLMTRAEAQRGDMVAEVLWESVRRPGI